jgi:hypothetical protein
MDRAIRKYGWKNVEHITFASHLTREEAENMEKLLIKELHTLVTENGYNVSTGGLGYCPEMDTDSIIFLWESGLSRRQICAHTGHAHAVVRKVLMDYGISEEEFEARKRSTSSVGRKKRNDKIRHSIISLWNDGLSKQEIASKIGTTPGTVGYYLR